MPVLEPLTFYIQHSWKPGQSDNGCQTWSTLENPSGALPQGRTPTSPQNHWAFSSSPSVHPAQVHDQSPSGMSTFDPRSTIPPNRQSHPGTGHSVPLQKRALPFVGPVLPSAASRQNPAPQVPRTWRPDQLISTSDCFGVAFANKPSTIVSSGPSPKPLICQGGHQAKKHDAKHPLSRPSPAPSSPTP